MHQSRFFQLRQMVGNSCAGDKDDWGPREPADFAAQLEPVRPISNRMKSGLCIRTTSASCKKFEGHTVSDPCLHSAEKSSRRMEVSPSPTIILNMLSPTLSKHTSYYKEYRSCFHPFLRGEVLSAIPAPIPPLCRSGLDRLHTTYYNGRYSRRKGEDYENTARHGPAR